MVDFNYTIEEIQENTYKDIAKELLDVFLLHADGYNEDKYISIPGVDAIKIFSDEYVTESGKKVSVQFCHYPTTTWYYVESISINIDGKQFCIDVSEANLDEDCIVYPYFTSEDPGYNERDDGDCLVEDLLFLCETALEISSDSSRYSYLLQYCINYCHMVKAKEFSIWDLIPLVSRDPDLYLSVYNRRHYYDEPEPRPYPDNYDHDLDDEFWEAVDNMLEK